MAAGVIWQGEQVLLAQRPVNKLLGDSGNFRVANRNLKSLPECLQRELREELGISVLVGAHFATVRHVFTHFKSRFRLLWQPYSPIAQRRKHCSVMLRRVGGATRFNRLPARQGR